MKIILCASIKNNTGKQLHQLVQTASDQAEVEMCATINSLSKSLQQPLNGDVLGLFLTTSPKELNDLASIHHLFRGIRFILILPDRNENTISAGHSLRPRFLGYADSNLKDVEAVMNKMIEMN
jgi:hypothetical protein